MAESTHRDPMVITHDGGLRFAVQIRSHRITVDQPRWAKGDDAGPAPTELLGASLGACMAFYVQQFCQARGIPTEGLRVEVGQTGAQNPGRIARFDVRMSLAAPVPPQYEALLERVARTCPVHNTLVHGAEVSLTIDAPAVATSFAG